MAERIRNAMSIDVEDYFQVSAFAPHIRREDWDTLPCRVERNVDVILGLLDEANAKATFFTLGWIAERYPQVVRRIVDNGHELASHGYGHQRASDLTPEQFRDDITRAKHILEDLGGVAIRGYRAPSFSINRKNWWAVEELEPFLVPARPRRARRRQGPVRRPRRTGHRHRPGDRGDRRGHRAGARDPSGRRGVARHRLGGGRRARAAARGGVHLVRHLVAGRAGTRHADPQHREP